MKLNLGSADRFIRLIVAGIIAALYFSDQISGLAALILGVLALVFALTSFIGVCPLYLPFQLSTKKAGKLA